MKKLLSFLAIALFLSIPLAANADSLGTGTMDLTYSTSYSAGGDYLLYYGYVPATSWGYSLGTSINYVGIFCISSEGLVSGETFTFYALNSSNDMTSASQHSTSPNFSAIQLSQAAWIADNWNTSLGLGSSSDANRAAAQLAIWAVLNLTLASGTAMEDLGQITGAQTLYNAATGGTHNGYTTGNWYAAFDSQDYMTPLPEPGILILLGIAMSAIGAASWRIRKL